MHWQSYDIFWYVTLKREENAVLKMLMYKSMKAQLETKNGLVEGLFYITKNPSLQFEIVQNERSI